MTATVRHADVADLPRIAAYLDEEFVFGKGRSVSLAERFPNVFMPDNARNLFLIEQEGAIVSALITLPFDWRANGRKWRGAMIGAVHTDAPHRGKGYARLALQHAQNALREAGVDFTVLWTIQNEYYRMLGWQDADRGVLGEAAGERVRELAGEPFADSPGVALADELVTELQAIRARWQLDGLLRNATDYRRLPLPAESVQALIRGEGDSRAYALVGRVGTTGVVYEMIGDPGAFEQIWRDVRSRFAKVLVNDCEGSASHAWHRVHSAASWQPKPLAMWHPLSPHLDFATMRNWYVPYFDRI